MDFSVGLENLMTNGGVDIALAGMIIVFVALATMAFIISLLPLVVGSLEKIVPVEQVTTRKTAKKTTDDDAVAVALAFAFHHHRSQS